MVTGTGMGRLKPLGSVLFFAFILLMVLLLGGAVYLAYPFLSRAVAALFAALAAWRSLPRPFPVEHLRVVNHLLWLFTAFLVAERGISAVRRRSQLRAQAPREVYARYVQPLLMHPLAFLILLSTRNYLEARPEAPYAPGYLLIGVLLVYGKHLLTSLLRNLGNCLAPLYSPKISSGLKDGFAAFLGLLHGLLFGYFLVRVLLEV
jgi:hypothetical protein